MFHPGNEKGAVVIKTKFGDVAADSRNFSKPVEDLWKMRIGKKK